MGGGTWHAFDRGVVDRTPGLGRPWEVELPCSCRAGLPHVFCKVCPFLLHAEHPDREGAG